MSDSSEDKNLPATEKRLREARKDGQVARSRDLTHLAVLGMGLILVFSLAPWLWNWLLILMQSGLRLSLTDLNPDQMGQRLLYSSLGGLALILLLGSLISVGVIAANIAVGGWNFTMKAVSPKFSKLNPLSGIMRLFSKQQLIDTAKSLLMLGILSAVAYGYLRIHTQDFMSFLSQDVPQALSSLAGTLWGGLLLLLLVVGAFALVDAPLQKFMMSQRLRMSHQEVKQEHKESDGNPEIKGRLKQRMREISQRRMLAAVPKADLVVINPEHYSVALRYAEGESAAPIVVAKGADFLAMKIRELAKSAQVPVLSSPPLARALYTHVAVDKEVPQVLFAAVAQILAYVYQLRAAAQGQGKVPGDLPLIAVPAGLDPLTSSPHP